MILFKLSCYRKNKTCLECRKSKKKCGNYNQDGRCGRCHKKNKTCKPYTSFQGRRNDLTMKRKSIKNAADVHCKEAKKCCGLLASSTVDANKLDATATKYDLDHADFHLAETPDCCGFLAASAVNANENEATVTSNQSNNDVVSKKETPDCYGFLATSRVNEIATLKHEETHFNYGLDLSRVMTTSDDTIGITSDFFGSIVLTTPCVGSRRVFVVDSSSDLKMIRITGCHQLDKNSSVTFIESTQLCKFPQSCAGNVCVFDTSKQGSMWKLGIIQNLFPLNAYPIVWLFCWNGAISSIGMPAFSSNHPVEWDDIKSHFSLESHFLNDIELVFVNQVCGKSIRNVPICETTSSAADGAIQCSLFGPDVFSPSIDLSWSTGSNDAFDFSLVKFENYHKEVNLPVTYVKNKSVEKVWNKF